MITIENTNKNKKILENNENYQLNILSNSSENKELKKKKLKQYTINGKVFIGAEKDEPFWIEFINKTNSRLQIAISLDGVNILTGKQATEKYDNDMWLIYGRQHAVIKCFPETSKGGAEFIFTSLKNSVALNTGNGVSKKGLIEVEVYREGSSYRSSEEYQYGSTKKRRYQGKDVLNGWNDVPYMNKDALIGESYSSSEVMFSGSLTKGVTTDAQAGAAVAATQSVSYSYSANANSNPEVPRAASASPSSYESFLNIDYERGSNIQKDTEEVKTNSQKLDLETASVGAGKFVEQKIKYVSGIQNEIYEGVISINYVWWQELQEMLNALTPEQLRLVDGGKKIMSLGNTPRIGEDSVEETVSKFERLE